MYRALPVLRQAKKPECRGILKVSRRRFASESAEAASTPPPTKKKRVFRRVLVYTTLATGTFYVGSAFVAYNNRQFHEFFLQNVPLGASVLEYGELHGWDELTVNDVIDFTQNGALAIYRFGRKALGYEVEGEESKASDRAAAKASAEAKSKEVKGRIQKAMEHLKTDVKMSEEKVFDKGSKAAAITRHQAEQFSEGVEDLVRKAETALAGKPLDAHPEATTTPNQPSPVVPDALGPKPNEGTVEEASPKAKNIYDVPLPLGFEPPPGFSRPAPQKPAPAPNTAKGAEPAQILPLVAPTVAELSSSDPVLAHLASTIDDLSSFLNANPSAATKARDVLETAKVDLTNLAEHFNKLREEEQLKLEQQLDEQARQYTMKLLELEMEAQDKLDSQEAGFREFFDEEKAKFVNAYREKLDRELQTQSEIINERLKEEVIAQGIELQRRWIREIKVRVEQERGGRLAKLDELAAGLKRLERVALDNSDYLDENLRIHSMWTAIRALQNVMDAPTRKPFRDELRVLRHIAAAKNDALITVALESLETSDTPDIGIEPLTDLTSWFTTSVAPRVSRVALVPDQNAGVLSHLASHILSTFSFRRQGLVPGDDVLSVLSRAEYYLNEKDLDSAARELNQLRGTAKLLLQDWLAAARRRLEVEQALAIVDAQATLASLSIV